MGEGGNLIGKGGSGGGVVSGSEMYRIKDRENNISSVRGTWSSEGKRVKRRGESGKKGEEGERYRQSMTEKERRSWREE